MVMIDFDKDSLLAQRSDDLWAAGAEIPVRLKIADIDLLGWEKGWPQTWGGPHAGRAGVPVNVIDMAWWGPAVLKHAKEMGGAILWLGMYGDRGELLFKMSSYGEEIVVIHSTPQGETVKANYHEVLSAWREFSQRVRIFILQEFPTLKDQPDYLGEPGWQEWLAGEEASRLPGTLGLVASEWDPYFTDRFEHIFLGL